MSALLMTLALAATFPEPAKSPAPAKPAADAAMKDCCAKMKAEGKECCCCKDKTAGHGDHGDHGDHHAKTPAAAPHAH